jgi:hypothetical protein
MRASIGWQISPEFSWRIDLFTNQFDVTSHVVAPCPSFGCLMNAPHSESVSGLTANGLLNLDSRGIAYLIGGAGLYHVQTADADWGFGLSAGAGIAVPVAPHVRVFAEAAWHGLLGLTPGPSSIVPITIGLRF